MAYLQGLSLSMKLMMGGAMPRMTRERAFQSLWNHYRCKDDRWIALAMLQADRYWPDFARALGRPDLVDHEKFKDMTARAQNAEEVIATLDAIFITRTREEWMQILRDAPGDFIYTVVNDVNELADDPQMRPNDYIIEFDHPQHGPTEMVGIPIQLSETPGSVRMPAPELGQHSEEVLLEVLGYDWERIADLRKREVI
jgi:crotonobetainyl-CoA:carnitine CoA-transferase CaiB-like acyl-CoA transferase